MIGAPCEEEAHGDRKVKESGGQVIRSRTRHCKEFGLYSIMEAMIRLRKGER